MYHENRVHKKQKRFHGSQLALGSILLLISLTTLLIVLSMPDTFPGKQNKLQFSEILLNNDSILTDEDGDFPSWFDIYNNSSQSVSLDGYSLTDRIEDPQKWVFPDVMLRPGEHLTVFLSGKTNLTANKQLHAGFTLDVDQSELLLINKRGNVVDSIPMSRLRNTPRDVSYGRDPYQSDRWVYFVHPEPGKFNTSQKYEPIDQEQNAKKGNLVINEVMAHNRFTYADDEDDFFAWIEIYNGHEKPLNLESFVLSNDKTKPSLWHFPDVTINPGAHMIVFASGKDRKDPSSEYLHTNFQINQQNDIVILTCDEGYLLDWIEINNLPTDVSYGRNPENKNSWSHFIQATPGEANNTSGYDKIDFNIEAVDSSIYINEIMASNQYTLSDEDGDYPDWIELFNNSDQSINLQGYMLSIDADEPMQWVLPDIDIGPYEYLLLFASGKDRRDPEDEFLHTSFRINKGESVLYFRKPDAQIIDRIVVEDHISDVSYGRDPHEKDTWYYYPRPTPGWKNETRGFDQLASEPEEAGILVLNEIMAMNLSTHTDNYGEYPNWIELFNAGDTAINLKGFGLSDQESHPMRWVFPDIDIKPGEYFVVYASGRDAIDLEQRILHTNFGVSTLGEQITLSDPIGRTIDSVHTGRMPEGVSLGRSSVPNSEQEWVYFDSPSPGKINQGKEYLDFSRPPLASKLGGFFDDTIHLSLENINKNGEIRYTTDGSIPSKNAFLYTESLAIEETTVVRAAVFAEDELTHDEMIHTYFINEQHTLPVVSITVDPFEFEDPIHGIHSLGPNASPDFPYFGANFHEDIEIPGNFEFFESDGKLGYDLKIGFKLFGAFSRGMEQKSFAVYARNRYEFDTMTYPFLENKDLIHFKHLVLRTSGQDATRSLIRDIMMTSLIQDETTLDYQGYRQSVLYINGRYWGVYNIREKINRYFIYYNHDLADLDAVDILEGNARTPSFWKSGDNQRYDEMLDYVTQHDMNDPEHYAVIESQVDLKNFSDYWIAQMFFANTDTGNIRYWSAHDPETKWRWIIYDLDWGFHHLNHNSIVDMTHPQGTGYNRVFSTRLIRGLLESEAFREMFINRFAYHLNHTFETQRIISLIDDLAGSIKPEMPQHVERWVNPASLNDWQDEVESLRSFARHRPLIVAFHLQEYFNLKDQDMRIFDVWRNR